jgi:hypothetical protein
MLKRALYLLGTLIGIGFIIFAAPAMLIVPSGQSLKASNYLSAVLAVLIGISVLLVIRKVSKHS